MGKTVMIVEDNELNMKLFGDILDAHGYQTIRIPDGEQALETARSRHPDLIVMISNCPESRGWKSRAVLSRTTNSRAFPWSPSRPLR